MLDTDTEGHFFSKQKYSLSFLLVLSIIYHCLVVFLFTFCVVGGTYHLIVAFPYFKCFYFTELI